MLVTTLMRELSIMKMGNKYWRRSDQDTYAQLGKYQWQMGKFYPSDVVENNVMDSDWDKYEVGSSFLIEEPYQSKRMSYFEKKEREQNDR